MRTIMLAEFAASTFLTGMTLDRTDANAVVCGRGPYHAGVRWTAWRGGRSPLLRAREGLAIRGAALLDSRYFPRWSSWL